MTMTSNQIDPSAQFSGGTAKKLNLKQLRTLENALLSAIERFGACEEAMRKEAMRIEEHLAQLGPPVPGELRRSPAGMYACAQQFVTQQDETRSLLRLLEGQDVWLIDTEEED